MYTFEQLKEDVRKEAEALRVHATKEERERLCFATLEPNNGEQCIYGQMTGECDCERASELIKQCTSIFFESESCGGRFIPSVTFAEYRWSPIELYILLPEANNANLIAFLRGETETLEL
jgi:hypothetical protein